MALIMIIRFFFMKLNFINFKYIFSLLHYTKIIYLIRFVFEKKNNFDCVCISIQRVISRNERGTKSNMSEIAKPRWVDHGINIQSCSRVPSAAPLKYDSITLWDKMNRIHHFDVFVRFVSRYWHGLPLWRVKNPKGNEKCRNPEMQQGQPEKSIKCHCLMVSPSP